MTKRPGIQKLLRYVSNILFIGLLLLLVFSPDAKTWLLKQLLAVGLFKADIKKDAVNKSSLSFTDFSYRDDKGNVSSISELKGKVVFINFWATWCPPCRAEMPSLNKLYNQLREDDRFVFLFMDADNTIDKAKFFLKANHYSLPVVTAVGNIPAGVFGGTLPTTIVLDKQGKMVMKHEGISNYNNISFFEELKSLQ